MASNQKFLDSITEEHLNAIEELASGNMAPSSIALRLKLNKAAFMRLWRQHDSNVRESYERGRLAIQQLKAEVLEKQIFSGNITAIQIHDKHSEEAEFEAMKAEIFGFNE